MSKKRRDGDSKDGNSKNAARKELDEFLAAPEQLLKNESELAKAHRRKEHELARAAQLKSLKLTTPPTVEDMLTDIVRVAEDEHLNPFHVMRTISAQRYELYGYYSIQHVYKQFGQFFHALEAAGLRDQPGTRLWKANRARDSRNEHTARYLERYVAPYVDRAIAQRELVGSYRLLSISDIHGQFLCPFTWLAFLSAVRDLKPDGVLLNGDNLDAVSISRHAKIPGWTPDLQVELDFHHEIYRQVRTVHDGDLYDTGGNHDLVDRLAAYLTHTAKELAGLRSLRVDKLLGLDDFGVSLFHGGSIVSPEGTEDAKHGFMMFGFYRVHHGVKTGKVPAADELKAAGRSGQSGHVHRASLAFGTTERDEALSWMSTPCACRHEAARAYMKGCTGWQRGFGYTELFPDGSVHQYPVVVQAGERVSVEGFRYERPDSLKDPKPEGVWLKDLKLG